MHTIRPTSLLIVPALLALTAAPAIAQRSADVMRRGSTVSTQSAGDTEPGTTTAARRFTSRADSLDWVRARALAHKSTGFRIVISLKDRHLWAIIDKDTVMSAPAAVAKGETFSYAGRSWTFTTPRGRRSVLRKEADPVWLPPDWLYAETAAEHGLKLAHLPMSGLRLKDGRRIVVRDKLVGLILPDGKFGALPTDEHIVFNNTLYIPPIGTENRRIEGELGKYRLDLGEGYLLHGTPYKDSIGLATTHGCIRLRDDDIQWLYENIPVGTRVFIY